MTSASTPEQAATRWDQRLAERIADLAALLGQLAVRSSPSEWSKDSNARSGFLRCGSNHRPRPTVLQYGRQFLPRAGLRRSESPTTRSS